MDREREVYVSVWLNIQLTDDDMQGIAEKLMKSIKVAKLRAIGEL